MFKLHFVKQRLQKGYLQKMSERAEKPRAHCALNLKGFKTDYTQSPELLLLIAALGAHALFV